MALSQLTFNQALNSSLQIGDLIYYVPTSTLPNSTIQQAITSNVTYFGVLSDIIPGSNPIIEVVYDPITVNPPIGGEFIVFEKDKRVNSSSLIGYYADVKLKNYSDGKIEMFSLAAGVSENSK